MRREINVVPPLKASPKELELYSWQVFDMWLYVLLPSDSERTWADLAAAQAYHERDELKKALGKLPKGTRVSWLVRCAGAPPGRLNRPLVVFQKELIDFCHDHGLTLTVSETSAATPWRG